MPAGPPAPGARRRRWLTSRAAYLLVIPAVVLELLIHVIPTAVGVVSSTLKLNQYTIAEWLSAPFVGLDNFRISLDFSKPIGEALLHSFVVTILYTVIVVFVSWFLGFAAALVLQQRFRGRGLVRTVFLISYAMPAYAGILVWSFMLQRDNGLINHILVNDLHLLDNPPFWLVGSPAFASTAIVAIWRLWPFAFLMTMVGMQSIPDEAYEAAAMDGAGPWKRTWHITFGMLQPVTAVLLLMMFLWTFNDFNTPFVLFGSAPPASIDLLSIHIYDSSFSDYNFGLGSAMSVLMLIFLLVVSGLWFLFERRHRREA